MIVRKKGRLPHWSELDDIASEDFHQGLEELKQEKQGEALPLAIADMVGAANDNENS